MFMVIPRAALSLLPWVASGFAAAAIAGLAQVWVGRRGLRARVVATAGGLALLVAGNVFWFSAIDNRGGLTSAAFWKLRSMEGNDLASLWRSNPERLGGLSESLDVYLACRPFCRGRPLRVCGGRLLDVQLDEHLLRTLSRVSAVQSDPPSDSLERPTVKTGTTVAMTLVTRDGRVFDFVQSAGPAAQTMILLVSGRHAILGSVDAFMMAGSVSKKP
jgi:hypothetical protein